MYGRIIARLLLISGLASVIFIACARISAPSGGPKDKLPPVVVKSIPVNGAKNFKGKKLEIFFDEYVALDNINEKFMVSPPMKKKPKVSIKGKAVEVDFDEKLKDSTTYTFYFRDAIKDLNEGNPIQNYQFVLSTGPVIDSLSVTGNIYYANNLEVPEKTEALLYSELADSDVVKHLPDYISSVDQSGYFRIDNVRPGTYRLYGLKDGDNSKSYNLPDEEFAFMDSIVVITPEKNYIPPLPVIKDSLTLKKGASKTSSQGKKEINKATATAKDLKNLKGEEKVAESPALTGEYKLFQFIAKKKTHYLTSSQRDTKYQMLYILSLPPDTMKFEFSIPGADNKAFYTEPSRYRDTLKVWLTDSSLYSRPQVSTIVKYPFTDTLGVLGYKEDTIIMRYIAPRAPRNAKIKKPVFTFESTIKSGSLKPGQSVDFISKTPFRQPDTSRIRLYELVQKAREKVPYSMHRDSTNSCKYYLKAKLEQGKKYYFKADSASFGNIYNENSDTLGISFSIKDPDSYCKLTVEIKNYNGARIIQLLDKTEKLVSQTYMKSDGRVVFPLLETGTYRLRVIYDLNGDGLWTTGDFSIHRQPEPVSYYPDEIELKQGWELEFSGAKAWDISMKNFKDPKLREVKKKK